MSRFDSYGKNTIGRWMRNRQNEFRWHTVDDDPYCGIIVMPTTTWFNTDIDAKTYVERMREEHGVDYEFTFGAEKTTMTWGSKLAKWEELEKCQRDPDYIVEYFKECYYQDETWEKMIAAALLESNEKLYMCVNPMCNRTNFADENDRIQLRHCQHCGRMTMVRDDLLLERGVPDGVFHNLMANNIHVLDRRIDMNNTLLNIAATQDKADILYRGSNPFLCISTSMPQLKVGGDHFIRGRVNREVLGELGFDVNRDHIMISFESLHIELASMLRLLFSDENIMLDESKAEKFRQEYIDGQWDDEFVLFVDELVRNGTLKVDSSGVQDTLTVLYNMAQRMSGKKTIIKRAGKIVFPTREVLENISQPLIEKAFSVTEHGNYTDYSEVFQVDEGAAE